MPDFFDEQRQLHPRFIASTAASKANAQLFPRDGFIVSSCNFVKTGPMQNAVKREVFRMRIHAGKNHRNLMRRSRVTLSERSSRRVMGRAAG
jgi:hypothetical protein